MAGGDYFLENFAPGGGGEDLLLHRFPAETLHNTTERKSNF